MGNVSMQNKDRQIIEPNQIYMYKGVGIICFFTVAIKFFKKFWRKRVEYISASYGVHKIK